jgi:hypothetical protein
MTAVVFTMPQPGPLPPTVHGPITPVSKSVQVTGILPSSTVKLYANGSPIPGGTATNVGPGTVWVPVPSPLQVNQQITATQTYNGTQRINVGTGVESDPSEPVQVINPPVPLPGPVFISPLSTCVEFILLDSLIPGAAVTIAYMGGQTIAQGTAGRQTDSFSITSGITLTPGTQLVASQKVVLGNRTLTSPQGKAPLGPSGLQAPSGLLDQLPQPQIQQPLLACQTSLKFSNMVPTANVSIQNDGQYGLWPNVARAYTGNEGPPLKVGTLTATQQFPRCPSFRQGVSPPFSVAPGPPPLPTVTYPVCQNVRQLTVSNLMPGSILYIERVVKTDPGEYITGYGAMGVSGSTEPLPLPSGFAFTDPQGPVFVRLEPTLCGFESSPEWVDVPIVATPGPFPSPEFATQLYACARYVRITNAHPGSQIQVFSYPAFPRCDAEVAAASEVVLKLWTPLIAGERVEIRQEGCNADSNSGLVQVLQLPPQIPNPQIQGPVRPSASTVVVTNILPGAQVYLTVNGQLRSVVDSCLDVKCDLPIGSPALANGDQLMVFQSLCEQTSNPDLPGGKGAIGTVTTGNMKLTVSSQPSPVPRGSTATVNVNAKDADTGQPLNGLNVYLDSSTPIGTTGTPFSYTPSTNATGQGTVKDPPAYHDALFLIPLVSPPPLGVLTLALSGAGLPSALSITSVDWSVIPSWGAINQINLTGQTASTTLPNPTSSAGNPFTILGTVHLILSGWVNGVYYQDQQLSAPITCPVGTCEGTWLGQNLRCAWVLLWSQVDDGSGDFPLSVVTSFQGCQ